GALRERFRCPAHARAGRGQGERREGERPLPEAQPGGAGRRSGRQAQVRASYDYLGQLRMSGGKAMSTAHLTFTQWLAGAALALALIPGPAFAQPRYPSKPVRLIAPFAPGGLVDVLSRAVADKLKAPLGQPVIVDNRPGAGGNIGAAVVAKADPDGYTLLMSSAGILTINQYIYSTMPFDP